jgi:hypothetical protein
MFVLNNSYALPPPILVTGPLKHCSRHSCIKIVPCRTCEIQIEDKIEAMNIKRIGNGCVYVMYLCSSDVEISSEPVKTWQAKREPNSTLQNLPHLRQQHHSVEGSAHKMAQPKS